MNEPAILKIPYSMPMILKESIIIYGFNRGAVIRNVMMILNFIFPSIVLISGTAAQEQTGRIEAYRNAVIAFEGKNFINLMKYFSSRAAENMPINTMMGSSIKYSKTKKPVLLKTWDKMHFALS